MHFFTNSIYTKHIFQSRKEGRVYCDEGGWSSHYQFPEIEN